MKIVIADDHAVVRTGFSMILNYQDDMEVVATAADGVEAYQKVMTNKPDVLIMDLLKSIIKTSGLCVITF